MDIFYHFIVGTFILAILTKLGVRFSIIFLIILFIAISKELYDSTSLAPFAIAENLKDIFFTMLPCFIIKGIDTLS